MRIYGVVVVTNLAFALGLVCGYVWWQSDVERLRRELDGSRAQLAAVARTWTVKGVVRAVMKDEGLVVITHEPFAGMSVPMTMAFRVKDPRLVEGVESGDRVDFTVVPEGTELLVKALRRSPE
jgi:Cu(I)/Ag(I) efflux system protein CusF